MRAAKAAGSRKSARSKLFRIKVLSMGDQGAGKSCLIKRCARAVLAGCTLPPHHKAVHVGVVE